LDNARYRPGAATGLLLGVRCRTACLAVATEGLLRYLTFQEKARLAENVHEILQCYGSWRSPPTSTLIDASCCQEPRAPLMCGSCPFWHREDATRGLGSIHQISGGPRKMSQRISRPAPHAATAMNNDDWLRRSRSSMVRPVLFIRSETTCRSAAPMNFLPRRLGG
jgi:hypothetical protein